MPQGAVSGRVSAAARDRPACAGLSLGRLAPGTLTCLLVATSLLPPNARSSAKTSTMALHTDRSLHSLHSLGASLVDPREPAFLRSARRSLHIEAPVTRVLGLVPLS